MVTGVPPYHAQEPEEHQRLTQVDLEETETVVKVVLSCESCCLYVSHFTSVIFITLQHEVTSYLDEEFHQLPEAACCWPVSGTADNDTEEAADQSQVTAGVGVHFLWVPPHLTWQRGRNIQRVFTGKPADRLEFWFGFLPLKEAS